VFDRSSGTLLDQPDVDAILAVRQLTLMFDKVLLETTVRRQRKAMSGFIQCEQDVRSHDALLTDLDRSDFKRVSSLLFGEMFTNLDWKVFDRELSPKHGPGATADRIRGNGKYKQKTWTHRLQQILPWEEMLAVNSSFFGELAGVDILEPGAEIPVKVISVPKTLKTPRIIAVEPTAMQYAQQAILQAILEEIRSNDTLRLFLDTKSQTPNQRMALRGSLYGKLATLDLSEASDRVSNQLVREMLLDYPHLHAAVDACRSRKADVPGFGVVRLAKFASMGSALCFPFEAMVFLTIILLGIERASNVPLDPARLSYLVGKVRVYGDDIIVPVDYVSSVVETLETFGSKVNLGKSFWTGRFRESCGREYYAGEDVSIVRVRRVFPTQLKHATEIISMVSLRNQLYHAGYWETVKWLDEKVRGVIKYFPVVLPTSPVLGRHSFLGYKPERVGVALQNPIVKGYRVSSTIPLDVLEGHGALLKFFLKRGGLPSVDERHLERAGRPHAVDIKLGWASAV
jgi:hypothetical protein